MNEVDARPFKLKEIILNTRKPIVFKNFYLNWLCFQKGLEEWCKAFDESTQPTNFERISKLNCLEPQWERKRKEIQMTAMQFYKEHTEDRDYWSGLNYKRKFELPDKCTSGIDFSPFGFPQAADDSTLWLCSSGGNTPCHYDSYGCNIVVQVFGKKSWYLFPPTTPLTTTRIPYEESSIYCKENFYFPSEDMKKCIETYKDLVYHVVLEPNDVLIVPKHWWHYVEAIDISLSVNAWIPLKCDLEQHIEECIVKYLIENFVRNSSLSIKTYVMNPNQLTSFATNDELFKILKYLLDKSMKKDTKTEREPSTYNYHYFSESDVEQLLSDFKSSRTISPITNKELEDFLKACPTKDCESNSEKSAIGLLEEILINSICSPCIIKAIKAEFLKRYNG